MRTIALACLLLVGCGVPEVTGAGSRVRVTGRTNEIPAGCRMVGTLRDAEGGGLRSFEQSRLTVETRLRNEAGRLGGNTLSLIDVKRGDTDEGSLQFASGVAGLTTPNPQCTNCIEMTAQVFQCEGRAPTPVVDVRPVPVPRPAEDCVRPAAPPAAPPPAAAPPAMPAPAVTVIIIPAPPVYMPPAPPPPQRDDDQK
jgi:hypothetical protein